MSAQTNPKPRLISELPYAVLKRLADRLDLPCDGNQLYWRKLIQFMPNSPYDQLTVERFAMNANRLDGSPAYALLTDMGNRGTTYDQLVSLLKKLNLYVALSDLNYTEKVHFSVQPQAKPAVLGQRFTLECSAVGVPEPSYLWFKERTPLPHQTGSTLEIESVAKDDEGSYCCRAMNNVNVVFSNWAEVKVQRPSYIRNQAIPSSQEEQQGRPEILTDPCSQAVAVGQQLQLMVVATGAGPLSYQWFRNGQLLQFATNPELLIAQSRPTEHGVYSCRVTNEFGSVLSNEASVNVHDVFSGHPIQEPPQHAFLHSAHTPQALLTPTPMSEQYSPLPPNRPMEEPMMAHPFPGGGMNYSMPQGLPPEQAGIPPGMSPHNFPHQRSRNFSPPHTGSIYAQPDHHSGHHFVSSPPPPSFTWSPPQPFSEDEIGGQGERADLNAQCYDKVALLIGNQRYHHQTLHLNTPENDVQDLAGILRSAGFKVVSLVNLTKTEMKQAVDFFMSLIGKNVYALFFFAGHGFELQNMNYMMAVDTSREKNPQHSICAQQVLDNMQSRGAKLSIVLLDMCRVQAPPRFEGAYDLPTREHPGYFVYGFSCSPSERAYEVDYNSIQSDSLDPSDRENSIFVAALKEHCQKGSLTERFDVLLTDAAEGVRRRGNHIRCARWQKPEIRHNMGEPLSLSDETAPTREADTKRKERAQRWQEAHCVPNPVVVASLDGQLALRLHFGAEHSNVLIVTVELLNGCLSHTELESMRLELVPENESRFPPLQSEEYVMKESSFSYGHERKRHKQDLIHFKIPDVQRVPQSPMLRIVATYNYSSSCDPSMDSEPTPSRSCKLHHRFIPPPLYAKIIESHLQAMDQPPFSPFN